jgi:hypothetical protein
VEGIVLDGITGNPLAGAAVAQTTTDAQGRFSAEINAGSQVLFSVAKEGYRPPRLEGRKLSGNIPGNFGIPLNLAAGQKLTGLVVKLFPPGAITGRVSNHRGEAMQDAEIIPFTYLYNEAGTRYRVNLAGGTQKTNDLGEFRFNNLDTGDYYLEIRPSSPDLGGTSGAVLAPMFYPNALDPSKAEPVHVDGGKTTALGNLSAIAVRGGVIRLRLINQIGEAPRGTAGIASLFRADDFATTVKSEMRPHDQLGQTFELGRFPPGSYYFRAGVTSYSPGINEGRVKIELGEGDVEIDVPIVKFALPTIGGRAIVESPAGEARPVSGVRLAFIEIGANSITATMRNSTALLVALTSAPDGSFPARTITPATPPYAYRLRVLDIPEGMYVAAIRGGDPERFSPEPGRETSFTVVLGEGAGRIEGVASDGGRNPVSLGAVVLLPVDERLSHRIVTATTGMNGAFKLQAAPGDYHLYAWREMIGAPYLNADFMAKYQNKGLPVRVDARGRLTVNPTILED